MKRAAWPSQRTVTRVPAMTDVRRVVENVIVPGIISMVDASMYKALLRALFAMIPGKEPELTQVEPLRAVLPHLLVDECEGGARAGLWVRAMQLDRDAKDVLLREPSKPIRWHRRQAG